MADEPPAAPLQLREKVVRDLAWALASPGIFRPPPPGAGADDGAVPTLPDAWCRAVAADAGPWLAGLDADPAPLLGFLGARPHGVRAVGFYFAALLEYWLRHCPVRRAAAPWPLGC